MGLSRARKALRIAFVRRSPLLVALPAGAMGARVDRRHELDPFSNGRRHVRVNVNGGRRGNEITVTLAGGTFTVTDTAGVTAGTGCTRSASTTSPAPPGDITAHVINGGAGGDTLRQPGRGPHQRRPGPRRRSTAPTATTSSTAAAAASTPTSARTLRRFPLTATDITGGPRRAGRASTRHLRRPHRARSRTDLRPGRDFGDRRRRHGGRHQRRSRGSIGGLASDEIIGGLFGRDTSTAGPGTRPTRSAAALGKDTVDYSDKTAPVTVTLDGVLPTDPDITASAPRCSIGARAGLPARTIKIPAAGSATACRASASQRQHPRACPGQDLQRDCTADDGVAGENDCVGEDVENIVGSPQDDILIGNDPDPLYGKGRAWSPRARTC